MNSDILLMVLSAVLAIVAAVITVKWRQSKALLKSVSNALACISDAIDDDKVSIAEFERMRNHFADVVEAAHNLIK